MVFVNTQMTLAEIANREAANLRKLAAIDIYFLGHAVVFVEYACGVLLPISLGVFALVRSHSVWQSGLGVYLACLGINYLPMFSHMISIANKKNAQAELGDELIDKKKAMVKYRRRSLFLLVPLLPPLLSLIGPRRARSTEPS